MRSSTLQTPSRAAGLLAASAAVLFAAACGGSDSSGGSSSGQNGTSTGGNNPLAAYVECMKNNGVTITVPTGAGPGGATGGQPQGGFPSGGFPSGMPVPSGSAGASGAGAGGLFGKPEGVDDTTWKNAQSACASAMPTGMAGGGGNPDSGNAAYNNCLQENGVTAGGNVATDDPTVKEAMEACEVLSPSATASSE